jgi:hypothetical protein
LLKRYAAVVFLTMLGLASCGGSSKPAAQRSTTTTTDLKTELASFCAEVERVYQDEALPLSAGLVTDTLRLIDRLEGLTGSTSTELAKLRVDARKGPAFALIVVNGMRGAALCTATPTTPAATKP